MRVPDSPWFAALTTALAGVLIATLFVLGAHGHVSGLVQAGNKFVDPQLAPKSLVVADDAGGYDGQFYYRMAHAPFSMDDRVLGVRFDIPAFRSQRVVYPLLAWTFSGGGRVPYIPWSLVAVNVGALTACAWFGGVLARDRGKHAAWGLLAAGYPGFMITMSLDLAEIVASALVLAGLCALAHERTLLAGLSLSAATLARETAVLVVLGVVSAWFIAAIVPRLGGRPSVRTLFSGSMALFCFCGWQVLLLWRFGSLPLSSSGKNNAGAPFTGFLSEAGTILPPTSGASLFRFLSLCFLVSVIVYAGISLRRSLAPLYEKVAWTVAALMLVFLGSGVWAGATGFLRVTTELYLLSVLVVLGRREPLALPVALPSAAMSGLSILAQATKSV
ncbi:MAG: hypothetical protein M3011_03130 [Actinomycetota bacterium]|nr:hypothetical protein [Actinomycetota bacterium]